MTALGELYSLLVEEDMFFGLWRRRCALPETNAALSYEQNGYGQLCVGTTQGRRMVAALAAKSSGANEVMRRLGAWSCCPVVVAVVAGVQTVGQGARAVHRCTGEGTQWQPAVRGR